MVQSFNDLASPNGPVAGAGSRGGAATPPSQPSATGRPGAVVAADGTNSPRANMQTFRAAGNTTPGSMKNNCPAQSFNPGSV